MEGLWSIQRWKEIMEVGGTFAALLFTGIALHVDARVRRAETLLEITKQHRELWIYFDEHPKLARLFDKNRDMDAHPLADEEVRFANFLFLHLLASYGANRAKIHILPERVKDDWRELFSHPAISAAWEKMKHLHDRKFVVLVEKYRKQGRPTA